MQGGRGFPLRRPERSAGDDKEPLLRLFCLPYAGGRDTIYSDWETDLPTEVEVVPIELPGHGRRLREPLCTDIPAAVADVVRTIRPVLDRPFAFFGHSMGAIIVFELARHLGAALGLHPVCLYVSGRKAPHLPDARPRDWALSDDHLVAELRRLNGTQPEILEYDELMEVLLPILRADFGALQNYRFVAAEKLKYPVVAFGGTEDPEAERWELSSWSQHTSGTFQLHMVPGDHFFLHSSRETLLNLLAAHLSTICRFQNRRETNPQEND